MRGELSGRTATVLWVLLPVFKVWTAIDRLSIISNSDLSDFHIYFLKSTET